MVAGGRPGPAVAQLSGHVRHAHSRPFGASPHESRRTRLHSAHLDMSLCTLDCGGISRDRLPRQGVSPALAPNSAPDAVLAPAGNSTAEETCTSAACRQLRIKDVRAKVTPKEIAEAPLVGRVPYDTFPARSAGPDGPLPDFLGRSVWRLPCPPHGGRQADSGGARCLNVTTLRGRTCA